MHFLYIICFSRTVYQFEGPKMDTNIPPKIRILLAWCYKIHKIQNLVLILIYKFTFFIKNHPKNFISKYRIKLFFFD